MSLSQLLKGSGELQAELQLILNAFVEGLCGVDAHGNATFCNEALLEMTGYQAGELIGKNIHTLLHHSRPDGTRYPQTECPLQKAFESHQEVHVARECYWRKDGTCVPAEYHAHPLPRGSSLTACVITVQDISERERSLAALRTSEERFRQVRDSSNQNEEKFRRILASMAEVAWTSDRERRTIYVSPKVEAVLGYTKAEFCAAGGGSFRAGLIHPADFGRVNRGYLALFEKQSPYDEEYRIQRKDGTWIWIHDRATGTHEQNGTLYADGLFSDITSRKQAESELQSKTAFLEAQSNSTIDGILVVDGNGQVLLHNQRFVELFQIPPALRANTDDSCLLAYVVTLIQDPESFLAKVNRLYRQPRETSRDEIELKDGRILDRYSAPVVDQQGKYYGRIWTFRDITERKQTEQTLQRSEEKFRQLAENIHEVFWMMSPTADEILYVSPAYEHVWGRTCESLYQRPMAWAEAIHPDDLKRAHSLFARQMQGEHVESEYRIRTPDGLEKWISDRAFPVRDKDGQIIRVVGIAEEITERKRSEKELQLTRSSLANASDAVYWIDPRAHIVYANDAACRSLGYSREELVSLSIPDIDPLFPKETWDSFWQDCKERRSITLESQHRTKQGRVFPVEVTANFLEFDGQEYSFAFARDITERRELESQLRQAHKLEGIGQLASGIAHEINTPTQFVTDNLTFLRDAWKTTHELLQQYRSAIQISSPTLPRLLLAALVEAERKSDFDFVAAEVPHAIDQSLDGAHRVAEIVRAMKEFSHPDSVEKTATDLNKGVASTITVARNEWKYVADIATQLDNALPPVVCFPGDVNQVVLNLIVNAAHAIQDKISDGEKGKITVCTRMRGEFAEISVTDTGTGIPEAVRTRIFDPFFTTKEVGKGTGQGLSLAHAVIVKKHGGKIWFETEMGRGTTFFIDLPLSPPDRAKED